MMMEGERGTKRTLIEPQSLRPSLLFQKFDNNNKRRFGRSRRRKKYKAEKSGLSKASRNASLKKDSVVSLQPRSGSQGGLKNFLD